MPSDGFAPTPQAALHTLHAVRPSEYARTRNHIGGAVTRLSPYLTHGLLHMPDVMAALSLGREHELVDMTNHKLVMELGWREFFHHAWRHDGDAIFESLHEGPLPDSAYARELPADIREGRTGVPAIDQAVRALYAEGYVHNHARMWLASYVVHLRKVHWRAGADWLYSHLLDGDLASNHLSWQWVAGTSSHKPYLFNAENVQRFADEPWHSADTVIDAGYEALDRIAHSAAASAAEPGTHEAVIEPPRSGAPPADLGFSAPDATAAKGRDVWLVHPWSLADVPQGSTPIAVLSADFHRTWPWSERRWRFVGARMAALTSHRWIGESDALPAALAVARCVRGIRNPHLGATFDAFDLAPMPRAFADPDTRCRSFSAFWNQQADQPDPHRKQFA
jgi:deoxyribodipyrimidine photo-lyase